MPRLNTKVTRDGSVFWSYPANMQGLEHKREDPNFLAAVDFCDMHNILYDADVYKTLKHMPEYESFSFSRPGEGAENMRKDASEISREFARLAAGSHITVAVDCSRANSFFRKNELPEILSSPNIEYVRRLHLDEYGGYTLSYQSKDEWLGEQLQAWWTAAIQNNPDNATGEINRLSALINTDRTLKKITTPEAASRLAVYETICETMDPHAQNRKLQDALSKATQRFSNAPHVYQEIQEPG